MTANSVPWDTKRPVAAKHRFMTHKVRRTVAVVALAVVSLGAHSCGGRTPTSPATGAERPTIQATTAHFQILGDRVDAARLAAVADALESNYSRITSDLRVTGLASTSVWLWQDSTSYYADMASRGPMYPGAGGYVINAHAVSMLYAPGVPSVHVARGAVHEFAHVVSIALNPRIPNNPRWLWETVALYENGEFIDPSTLDYMRSGSYPSLADLDVAYNVSGRIYQVGFLLGEYIVARWGQDGFIRLIERNGDLAAAIGTTTADFESGWRTFLHEKYGLPLP